MPLRKPQSTLEDEAIDEVGGERALSRGNAAVFVRRSGAIVAQGWRASPLAEDGIDDEFGDRSGHTVSKVE